MNTATWGMLAALYAVVVTLSTIKIAHGMQAWQAARNDGDQERAQTTALILAGSWIQLLTLTAVVGMATQGLSTGVSITVAAVGLGITAAITAVQRRLDRTLPSGRTGR